MKLTSLVLATVIHTCLFSQGTKGAVLHPATPEEFETAKKIGAWPSKAITLGRLWKFQVIQQLTKGSGGKKVCETEYWKGPGTSVFLKISSQGMSESEVRSILPHGDEAEILFKNGFNGLLLFTDHEPYGRIFRIRQPYDPSTGRKGLAILSEPGVLKQTSGDRPISPADIETPGPKTPSPVSAPPPTSPAPQAITAKFPPPSMSPSEIRKAVLRAAEHYAKAICGENLEEAVTQAHVATLVPWDTKHGRDEAIFVAIWVGDVGAQGGSGSYGSEITTVRIGAGNSFYVDPRRSSPAIRMESPVRVITKLLSNTQNSLVLEGMAFGPGDPNCCPSVPTKFTLQLDPDSNWKLLNKEAGR